MARSLVGRWRTVQHLGGAVRCQRRRERSAKDVAGTHVRAAAPGTIRQNFPTTSDRAVCTRRYCSTYKTPRQLGIVPDSLLSRNTMSLHVATAAAHRDAAGAAAVTLTHKCTHTRHRHISVRHTRARAHVETTSTRVSYVRHRRHTHRSHSRRTAETRHTQTLCAYVRCPLCCSAHSDDGIVPLSTLLDRCTELQVPTTAATAR